jgi:hypothetical protein
MNTVGECGLDSAGCEYGHVATCYEMVMIFRVPQMADQFFLLAEQLSAF